jgi:phospholipid/cholesterol/gamma-HCH transport system substrate-binding protein
VSGLRSLLRPLLVVAATVGVILGGHRLFFPPGGGYLVRAEFKDAAGLTKNSDVKIGGVAGGKVRKIVLSDRDTALVTLELDKGAFPIGAGASAASRPVNLLGEKYVDMDPGDLSKPLESGSSIPMTRTSRPVELDDVLNMLQPDVRARLRILINEAGIGMQGRKADFNTILQQLPPALDQTGKLVRRFNDDNRTLGTLIDRSDRVLASISGKRGDLQSLLDAAAGTLETTVAKRRELADTVRAAPGALRQLRSTLGQVSDTATRLEPAAAQVRAASPSLAATLRDLPSFTADAKPTLAKATSVSPDLTRLATQGRPVVARLKPTAATLQDFAAKFAPLVKTFDEGGAHDFARFVNGWSRTVRRSDGLGHVFGLRILFDKEIVTTLLQRYVDPYTKPKPAGSKRKDSPVKAPSLPDLRPGHGTVPQLPKVTVPDVKLPTVPDVLHATKDAVDKVLGSVTHPSPQKSSGSDAGRLLDYLINP